MKPKLIANAILVSLLLLGGGTAVIASNSRGTFSQHTHRKSLIARLLFLSDRSKRKPLPVSIARPGVVLANLSDGNYRYCSDSVTSYRDEWCFDFVKTQQGIVGNYFDSRSTSAPPVCIEGQLEGNTIQGIGYKRVEYGRKRPDLEQEKAKISQMAVNDSVGGKSAEGGNPLDHSNLTAANPEFFQLIEPRNPNIPEQANYAAWIRYESASLELNNFESVGATDFKPLVEVRRLLGFRKKYECSDKDKERQPGFIAQLFSFGDRKNSTKSSVVNISQPGSVLENLSNGRYRYCSDSHLSRGEAEWCFDFVKTRQTVVGNYFYRTPRGALTASTASTIPITSASEDIAKMCIEGIVQGNAIKGVGYEIVEYGKTRPDIEKAKKEVFPIVTDKSSMNYWDDMGGDNLTAFSPNFYKLVQPENPNLNPFEPTYFAWIRYDQVDFNLNNFESVEATNFKPVKATEFIGYKRNYRCMG